MGKWTLRDTQHLPKVHHVAEILGLRSVAAAPEALRFRFCFFPPKGLGLLHVLGADNPGAEGSEMSGC